MMKAGLKHDAHNRITDLLAARAIQRLEAIEAAELDRWLAGCPEIDDTELDEAASALHLAQLDYAAALPVQLRARVWADAEHFFEIAEQTPPLATKLTLAEAMPSANAAPTELATAEASPPEPSADELRPATETQTRTENPARLAEVVAFPSSPKPLGRIAAPQSTARPASAWPTRWGWLAAAACLVAALAGAWKIRDQQQQIAALQATQAQPDFAALRQTLLAQGSTLTQLNWAAGTYPGMQAVRGDVVWSDAAQTGYMRFVGLPVNNPNEVVYQLWIFAANQEERYPVDGGVFNITSNGEVIVPIHAKLAVSQPSLFAVTLEKPGGVVVSKRDRLALLAKVG